MVAIVKTVAFCGVDVETVEVQCAISAGLPSFKIVGLPDKAVSEAKERVISALSSLDVAMPSQKVTINLAPADLPKYGSHFDLPIALSILGVLDLVPQHRLVSAFCMGELSLDGRLEPVKGALPAALKAADASCDLICPSACGGQAAWVEAAKIYTPLTLLECMKFLRDEKMLRCAQPEQTQDQDCPKDFQDVEGLEVAKRAMEIAAAGHHNLFMIGPPGAGKSMLASRLPSILPPLNAAEILSTSVIYSVSSQKNTQGISAKRPFRDPHHSATNAALIGGGPKAGPGEISLAHNGVLFLDELPEFQKSALEALRQPIETGEVLVSRAGAHLRYPSRFMLVAAANPCRCGFLANPDKACGRAPLCGEDYLSRISGPMRDRFDLNVHVFPTDPFEVPEAAPGEPSRMIATRVAKARARQNARYEGYADIATNSDLYGPALDAATALDSKGKELLARAANQFTFTRRGYSRVLKVARTIADLEDSDRVKSSHISEAVFFRRTA